MGQHLVLGDPAHDEGAPGDAQADTEGGLVGAVAAHVADDHVGGAVLLDGVVEVAAHERAFAAGAVVGTVTEG